MNKRCIVSFANARGNYYKAMERLQDSLAGNFTTGDFFGFRDEESIGAPSHFDSPYGFKIYAIEHVIELGYTSILWLDSSVYAIKPIDHLFDIIEKEGYLMQEAGAYVGEWTNDRTLDYFDLSRDKAMTMTMYGNAGLLGLDLTSETAQSFFNSWAIAERNKLFEGQWNNYKQTESKDPRCRGHRHDMAVGSIIANRLDMKYKPGNEILQYAAPDDAPINDTICLFAQGI